MAPSDAQASSGGWRLGPAALRGRRVSAAEATVVARVVGAEMALRCRLTNTLGKLAWVPAWAESPEEQGR